jgi:putative PIN family toxin of toxin-antitoxin system
MRVVFDTNLIISGLLWSGTPNKALQFVFDKTIVLITTEALIDELRDVLKRDKFKKYLDRLQKLPEELVEDLLQYAVIAEPITVDNPDLRDRDDLIVLEAAIGGKATFVTSGDDDLLSLRSYMNIPIITASQLIQELTP